MTILFTEPSFVPVSGNSVVYPGAKLYFYATETSTPQNTYSEYTLTTAHANPVVADADGRFAPIYLDPSLEDYKVVLKDSSDVTIWTVDPYSAINNTTRLGTMSDLLSASTALGTVSINGYHSAGDGGGGEFYWDASQDKTNHNGGTIIDPDVAFPSDWTNQTQVTAWFTAGTGTGCWVRVWDKELDVRFFGAVGDGVVNDRLAIIKTVQHVSSVGNGVVLFSAGTYLISGVAGTYDQPEIQSNLQYGNSSVQIQMYFEGLNNVDFVFSGAKLKSDKTDGGLTLCFDGCSNINIEYIHMEGATVMSGATATVVGTNGISFWSRSQDSTNITMKSPYINAHYGSLDIAGDPAAATKVSNFTVSGSAWFGNSYYGLSCRGNGIQVVVENALSYKQNRGFFIYDTEDVLINMDVDYIANTGLDCLVKAYTYNTNTLDIRMRAKNKTNVVTPRLSFQSQHNPALQPTPAYIRDVYIDYSEKNCGSGGVGIEFSYYRDNTNTTTSGDTLFDNFTIRGTSNNNLDSLVTLTNSNKFCAIDISKFFPANGFNLLDGKGFIGSKRFTYSPVIQFDGASVGVAYSVNSGNYYVANGLCFVNGRITLTALGSSTGNAQITLPIKTQTNTSINPLVKISLNSSVVGITGPVFGYAVVGNNDTVSLQMQDTTGVTSLTHANFSNTSDILFTAVYPI